MCEYDLSGRSGRFVDWTTHLIEVDWIHLPVLFGWILHLYSDSFPWATYFLSLLFLVLLKVNKGLKKTKKREGDNAIAKFHRQLFLTLIFEQLNKLCMEFYRTRHKENQVALKFSREKLTWDGLWYENTVLKLTGNNEVIVISATIIIIVIVSVVIFIYH